MPTEEPRARRRDATLNRESLLAAARELFARVGPEVPLEDIARLARVTRTTLYRNFPTRGDLAATLYEENVAHIEKRGRELASVPDGIRVLLDEVVRSQGVNRAVGALFTGDELGRLTELSERTKAAFAPLLASGTDAGVVRPGIDIDDVMLIFPMVTGVLSDIGVTDGQADAAVERALSLIHRALFADDPRHGSRAGSATPSRAQPLGVTAS